MNGGVGFCATHVFCVCQLFVRTRKLLAVTKYSCNQLSLVKHEEIVWENMLAAAVADMNVKFFSRNNSLVLDLYSYNEQ